MNNSSKELEYIQFSPYKFCHFASTQEAYFLHPIGEGRYPVDYTTAYIDYILLGDGAQNLVIEPGLSDL